MTDKLYPKLFTPVGTGVSYAGHRYNLSRLVEALAVPGGHVVRLLDLISSPDGALSCGPGPATTEVFFVPLDSIDAVRDAFFGTEQPVGCLTCGSPLHETHVCPPFSMP